MQSNASGSPSAPFREFVEKIWKVIESPIEIHNVSEFSKTYCKPATVFRVYKEYAYYSGFFFFLFLL